MKYLNTYITTFLLSFCLINSSYSQDLETDSLALVALYNACNGSNWNESWNLNDPISTWDNVLIGNNRVTSLDLETNNVIGTLPSQMANLTALTYLRLSGNGITNPASDIIGAMTALEIYYIENNFVSFSISVGFCQNPSLESLYMEDCSITGGIPSAIADFPSLNWLDLSSCNLSNTTIPPTFPSTLFALDLQDNGMNGNITNHFSNNSSIISLDLSNNNFTGSLPAALTNSQYLGYLDVSNNSLSGSLPSDIGVWETMTTFILSDNNFSGDLPISVNDMEDMDNFFIHNNNFTGPLPTSTNFYSGLQRMDVANNSFSGSIPATISGMGGGFIPTSTSLNLKGNNLSGSLPTELFSNEDMIALDLSENNFTGTIDASLFNTLNDLRILDLSDNNFSGQLPPFNLSDLRTLDITNNQFTGPFPNLSGLPELRNDYWAGTSISGSSTKFYSYDFTRYSQFCPGNNFTSTAVFDSNPDLITTNLDLSCFDGLPIDNDGDGFPEDQDCNDNNANINPDAEEIVNNNIDDNCDGINLVDQDEDGFTSLEDCDDFCDTCYPGAPEIINNGIDEDCNGTDSIVCEAIPIELEENVLLCTGGSVVLDAGNYDTYLWSNGETSQTITLDNIGSYSVTVTDASGCIAFANIEVTEYDIDSYISNLSLEAQDVCDNNSQITLSGFGADTLAKWIASGNIANPLTAEAHDMDGDGDIDIITSSSQDENLVLLENDGNQNFSEQVLLSDIGDVSAKDVVDMDGDGDMDIITGTWNGGEISFHENDGNLNFSTSIISGPSSSSRSVEAIDLDLDGDLDVIKTSSGGSVSWLENDGNLNFTSILITTNVFNPSDIDAADLDGDGDLDLVISEAGGDILSWHMNNGLQSFTETPIVTSPNGFTEVQLADIDEDGDIDILSNSMFFGVSLFTNDGVGNFTESPVAANTDNLTGIEVVDFDNDGDLDVVTSAGAIDEVALHLNDGNETFTSLVICDHADNVQGVFVEDMDGDGDWDIVSPLYNENAIEWYEQTTWTNPPLTIDYTIDNGSIQSTTGITPIGSSATFNIQNLAIGSNDINIVGITDNNGCSANLNLSTNINTYGITAQCTEASPTSGSGYTNGQASIQISDGIAPYTIMWSGPVSGQITGNDGTNIIEELAAGSYDITVIDANGCEENCSVSIGESNCIMPNASITGTAEYCSGSNTTLTASLDVTAATYNWSNGETSQSIQVSGPEATYTVTITDTNGCSATASEAVIVFPFSASCLVLNGETEAGNFDGTVEITLVGGTAPYDIQWNGPVSGNMTSSSNNATIPNLTEGNYIVIVNDPNGCADICSFTIDITPVEHIIQDGAIYTTCSGTLFDTGGASSNYNNNENMVVEICPDNSFGCLDLYFNAFGSEGVLSPQGTPYDYMVIEEITSGQILDTLYGGQDGASYETFECVRLIWISDGSIPGEGFELNWSCGSSACAGIQPNPTITGDAEICSDETSTLDAGNEFDSYAWSTGETSQTIEVSTSGTYSVTVTIANGNTGSDDFTIIVNPNPMPTITGDANACGTSTTLDAGDYPFYVWSIGQLGQTIEATISGTYTVSVTDSNGCQGTDEFVLNLQSNPEPIIQGNAIVCQGASSTLDAGNYTSYNWSTGETSQTIEVTTSGTYTVSVADDNGCQGTDEFILSVQPNPIPVITGNDIICQGENSTLDAGSYTSHNWSTGETSQTIEVTTSGTYTVFVTDDNGCEGMGEFILSIQSNPIPVITGNDIICQGESSTLDAGSYASYNWSIGETSQTIEVTTSGTYTVSVTDDNGCEGMDEFEINISDLDMTCMTGTPSSGSNDGTIDITISGGTAPYNITWTGTSNGTLTTNDSNVLITDLAEGNYAITTTDALGCEVNTTCSVMSTSVQSIESLLEFSLSPNPASSGMNVSLELLESSDITIVIYDIMGKTIYLKNWEQQSSIQENINLEQLPQGSYFMTVQIMDEVFSERFIIAR